MPAPTRAVPGIVEGVLTKASWRRVKLAAFVRALVAVWLVALGSIFCANGHDGWGAFIYVAAVVVGAIAFQMPRWKAKLDSLQNGPRVRALERSRALVVDDATARLRRIEQDLHDGAQARMVAVIMKLGSRGSISEEPLAVPDQASCTESWSSSRALTALPWRPSQSCARWRTASTLRRWTKASVRPSVRSLPVARYRSRSPSTCPSVRPPPSRS